MARITIRLDDDHYERLLDDARVRGMAPSTHIREILQRYEGTDPGGYHDRLDEIHATGIQTLAIVAKSIGSRTPEVLEEGLAEARRLLRERGLLNPAQDGQ
ncbi:MAG: hypothetical protein J7498_14330 [Sphingobium sp.]|nr:hypothetical protein [Sphingobium sp.]